MRHTPQDDANARLRDAAIEGHVAWAKTILGQGLADPQAKGPSGSTALMLAAEHGRAPCVELLLPVSDARAVDDHGQTAFMRASTPACLQALLAVSNPNAVCSMGRDALMHAAARGEADCVRWLIPVSNPSRTTPEMGHDALWLAVDDGKGSMECALALLPVSDARRLNRFGESLLIRLALGKNEGWLRALVSSCDVTTQDHDGRTALDWAIDRGLWENAELLAKGSPVEALKRVMDYAPESTREVLLAALEESELRMVVNEAHAGGESEEADSRGRVAGKKRPPRSL